MIKWLKRRKRIANIIGTNEEAENMQTLEDRRRYIAAKSEGRERFESWLEYRDTNNYKIWCQQLSKDNIDQIWIYNLANLTGINYYPSIPKYTTEELVQIAHKEYLKLKQEFLNNPF